MFVSAIILCSFLLHFVHYDVVISSIVVLNTLPCSLTSLSVLSFSLLLHHVFFSLRLFIIYTAPCETNHTYKTLETHLPRKHWPYPFNERWRDRFLDVCGSVSSLVANTHLSLSLEWEHTHRHDKTCMSKNITCKSSIQYRWSQGGMHRGVGRCNRINRWSLSQKDRQTSLLRTAYV